MIIEYNIINFLSNVTLNNPGICFLIDFIDKQNTINIIIHIAVAISLVVNMLTISLL